MEAYDHTGLPAVAKIPVYSLQGILLRIEEPTSFGLTAQFFVWLNVDVDYIQFMPNPITAVNSARGDSTQ